MYVRTYTHLNGHACACACACHSPVAKGVSVDEHAPQVPSVEV